MNEVYDCLEVIFKEDILKIIISNGNNTLPYKKIEIEKKNNFYQVSKYTEKQVFHENLQFSSLSSFCEEAIKSGYKQLNAFSAELEFGMKISKKGKVLLAKNKLSQPVKISPSHNRQKKYLLDENTVIEPLVDMGVFTKEGKIVNSMRDKYKQINKFLEFIDEAINVSKLKKLNIIDFGCGKSYLTFVVYYYLVFIKKLKINMVGLDLKEDVIEKCNKSAEKYGYNNLKFEVGNIDGYKTNLPIDLVISLHACDTATDYALFNAICWNSKMIISVPCCQHELASQLTSQAQPLFERYGIVKERSASLMTDAIRANLLECCGYKTQLLEFIDFEHTPKNILIRAIKSNTTKAHKEKMLTEVNSLCDCFKLSPALQYLLKENGKLDF